MVFTKPTCNWRVPPCRTEFHPQTCGSISSLGANNASSSTCSYGHLLVITCCFYGIIHSINKAFLVLITGITRALTVLIFKPKNCGRESPNRQTARCTGQASPSEPHIIKPFHCHTCFFSSVGHILPASFRRLLKPKIFPHLLQTTFTLALPGLYLCVGALAIASCLSPPPTQLTETMLRQARCPTPRACQSQICLGKFSCHVASPFIG